MTTNTSTRTAPSQGDRFIDCRHRVQVISLALGGLQSLTGKAYPIDPLIMQLDQIVGDLEALGEELWPDPAPVAAAV